MSTWNSPMTKKETAAVEAFEKSGDLGALKAALGTKNGQTAHTAIARVMIYKALEKQPWRTGT